METPFSVHALGKGCGMKKSISYWAFPGGLEGTKSIPAAFKEAKEAGFEAVELAIGETG